MQMYSHFFSKNISIYALFNDQSFNDTLTNNNVSFEQLGPGCYNELAVVERLNIWISAGQNLQ